jgi:hypothetical protein
MDTITIMKLLSDNQITFTFRNNELVIPLGVQEKVSIVPKIETPVPPQLSLFKIEPQVVRQQDVNICTECNINAAGHGIKLCQRCYELHVLKTPLLPKFKTVIEPQVAPLNHKLDSFVKKVGQYLAHSGYFPLGAINGNKIECNYNKRNDSLSCIFDEKTKIVLTFDEEKLTIKHPNNKITIYEWQDSFEIMETNFGCHIGHFTLMLITGFNYNITMKSFDEFTIVDRNVIVKHQHGTDNNYYFNFLKKCIDNSYECVGYTRDIESYMKLMLL